jgi:hypothetical protein
MLWFTNNIIYIVYQSTETNCKDKNAFAVDGSGVNSSENKQKIVLLCLFLFLHARGSPAR